MAENVRELLVKYKADISELQLAAARLETEVKRIEATAGGAGNAIGQAFTKQVQQVDVLSKRLASLKVARDQSQDSERTQRLNVLIETQGERIKKLSEFGGIKIIDPTQLSLIESATKRLAALKVARDESTDPARTERINNLIQQQTTQLQKLSTLKQIKPVDPAQIGIIENITKRIQTLTTARDKSNDPAKITRYNQLIEQQRQRLNELSNIKSPQISGDLQKQLQNLHKEGINPLKAGFEELSHVIVATFAISNIEHFIDESVKAFAEQQDSLERLKFSITQITGGAIEDVNKLNEQAEELGKKTFFEPTLITKSQNLQAQFGLTAERIQQLTPLIVELAAGLKVDLPTATDTALRAIEGQTRGLKVLGADFKDSGDPIKNYNLLIQNLSKLQGTAANALQTTAGELKNQEKELEIIKERVGGEFAESFIKVKELFLEVGEGAAIVTSNVSDMLEHFDPKLLIPIFGPLKAVHDAIFGIGKESEVSAESAKKLIENLVELSKEDFKNKSLDELENKLPGLVTLLNQVAQARKEAIASGNTGERERNDRLLIDLFAQKTAIQGLVNQKKEQLEFEKKFTKDLAGLTKEQLKSQIEQLRNLKNAPTIDVRSLIDAREKAIEKLEDQEKKRIDDEARRREEASKHLIELDKKTQDDLTKAQAKTDIERLAAEKQILEKELQQTFSASKKTVDDRKNLNDALLNLLRLFGIKERDIIRENERLAAKERQDQAKKQIDDVKNGLSDALAAIDDQQAGQTIKIKQDFITEGDFSPQAEKRLQQQLLDIDNEFGIKRLNVRKEFTQKIIDTNKRLIDSIIDSANIEKRQLSEDLFSGGGGLFNITSLANFGKAVVKKDQEVGERRKEIEKDVKEFKVETEKQIKEETNRLLDQQLDKDKEIGEKRKEIEKEILDTIVSGTEDIIKQSLDRRSEEQIRSIESVRDAQLESIDAQIDANKKLGENNAITAKEERRRNEELLRKKKQDEDRAADAIAKIKRKQFQADQLAAVAKIGIATAVNITEFPTAAALYAALGIAQTAIVLAKPNPYKAGTKKSKKGLAKVGEEGEELMYLPEGAKVVSHPKTKENERLIDAMIDDNVDEHIQKVFVKPELEKQKIILSEKFKTENPVITKLVEEINSGKLNSIKEKTQRVVNNIAIEKDLNPLFSNVSESKLIERVSEKIHSLNEKSSKESVIKTVREAFVNERHKTTEQKLFSVFDSSRQALKESFFNTQMILNENKNLIQSEIRNTERFSSELESEVRLKKVLSTLQISPQLKQAEAKYKKEKEKSFADNIANSFATTNILNGQLTANEMDWIRRKGNYIRNSHTITEPIVEAVNNIGKKESYKR